MVEKALGFANTNRPNLGSEIVGTASIGSSSDKSISIREVIQRFNLEVTKDNRGRIDTDCANAIVRFIQKLREIGLLPKPGSFWD